MELLERNKCLAELTDWLRRAIEDAGCIVLLGAEAGIGKTALLQEFAKATLGARVLWGGCDALFAPRPLGPLYDIARQTQGVLLAAITSNATAKSYSRRPSMSWSVRRLWSSKICIGRTKPRSTSSSI
jgi:predicted ATPase